MDSEEYATVEMCAQPYNNCKFSAGIIEGHPVENIYLKIEGEGRETREFWLRADEAQAIAWVLNGALMGWHMKEMREK
jgi:dTDP-D-glucose 4,6-dehydratase